MRLLIIALCLIALGVLLFVKSAHAQQATERYTYQRTVLSGGEIRYTETYEQRERDIDDSTFHTTTRIVRTIDKTTELGVLVGQKQALQAQAAALQNRIDALTALP